MSLVVLIAFACSSPAPTTTPSPTQTPAATSTVAPSAPQTLFDFGDAPDPSYPTLLASNGARTRVIDRFWLGNLRTPSVTGETEANVVDRDELDDGLESYVSFNGQTRLTFRAVRGPDAEQHLPYFIVYFNLLVDLDRDGQWQGLDWVSRNREVDLTDQNEVPIEVTPGILMEDTWIRAALTDTPVADSAAGWDGSGEFAVGEIEDYYLPPSPPYSPPPSYPPYTPTPTPTYTPTYTPTPTPTSSVEVTPSHPPTPSPSPRVVYTGDFVVECDPYPAVLFHGESVTIALKVVSGQHTPPERFRASFGGEEGIFFYDPPADDDGWSPWSDSASVTFTSTHVDPPARVEIALIHLTLQSRSTTRTMTCVVEIIHTAPTAVPSQIFTPTIRVEPELVTLSLVGQVVATVKGTAFTPGGTVEVRIKPPNHPATTATARAGTDGQFSLDLNFQPGMPKGTWQVTATDRATGATAETTFDVR